MLYTKESCLNEVKKEIENKKALIDALERVERVRTKSGADFKILPKNFTNCTIKNEEYSFQPKERELKVFYSTPSCGYESHKISLYCYFDSMSKDKIKHDPEPKYQLLKQIYVYDIDEIEEALKEEINRQRVFLEEYERDFETIENKFDEIEAKVNSFKAEMKSICNGCYELEKFVCEKCKHLSW